MPTTKVSHDESPLPASGHYPAFDHTAVTTQPPADCPHGGTCEVDCPFRRICLSERGQ